MNENSPFQLAGSNCLDWMYAERK